MDDDQIWEQLDLRAKKLCEALEEALEGTSKDEEEEIEYENENENAEDGVVGVGESSEDDEDMDSEGEEEEEEEEGSVDVDVGMEEVTQDLRDTSDDEEDEDEEEDGTMMLDLPGSKRKLQKWGRGRSELDDGFFDLTSFNAETDEAEAKSVSKGRLDVVDENDSSDEESVDLFAPVDKENLEPEPEDDGGAGMTYFFLP